MGRLIAQRTLALVEAVTRLVVQELVEGEQGDFLGGRGHDERRGDGQVGSRNGYQRPDRTAEGSLTWRCRRCGGATLVVMSSRWRQRGLTGLVTEMYARLSMTSRVAS